jgi:hypothetical protein
LIEVSEATVALSVVGNTLTFEKETLQINHMTALQIGCWAQSQMAQHGVAGVVTRVTRDQWLNGVYILFEAAVSRVFFETFATTLHGKAGGVNVMVNTSQRMLAVQLIERRFDRALDAKTVDSLFVGAAAETLNPDGTASGVEVAAGGLGGANSPGPKQHVLIKVSTDGRFVVTLTPASGSGPAANQNHQNATATATATATASTNPSGS